MNEIEDKEEKQKVLLPPRGTSDLFERRLLKIETINDSIFKIARSHGFTRIDLPVFESVDVFRRTAQFSEDSSFTFLDKSGREMVLRPDINAPISRAFVNHLATEPLPAKLFFEGKVFRYRHAKRREFRMFGLETYGVDDFSADGEIVSTVGEIITTVGFKGYEVEYGNLQIYKKILQNIYGQNEIDTILHKLHFADSSKTAQKILEGFRVPENISANLLAMLFPNDNQTDGINVLEKIAEQSQVLSEELSNALNFKDSLRSYGVTNIRLSLSNLHGTGFYSGMTYRIQPIGTHIPLADGGRYNTMVKDLGGEATPATGLAFGIEKIIDMAEDLGIRIPDKKAESYIVVLPKNTITPELRSILQQTRKSSPSITIEEELIDRRPEQTKKYGVHKGYKNAIFIESTSNDNTWPLKGTLYSLTNLSEGKQITEIKSPEDLVNLFTNNANV